MCCSLYVVRCVLLVVSSVLFSYVVIAWVVRRCCLLFVVDRCVVPFVVFVVRCALCVAVCSLLVVWCVLFAVRCLLFVVRCFWCLLCWCLVHVVVVICMLLIVGVRFLYVVRCSLFDVLVFVVWASVVCCCCLYFVDC